MDYEVDLDPRHSVIRRTVAAETVTLEPAEDIHQRLADVPPRGGPYPAIYAAKHTTLSIEVVTRSDQRSRGIYFASKNSHRADQISFMNLR